MSIPVTGYAHVRLTVRDIDVSRAFYESVFGLPVAFELPPDADAATREQLWFLFGGVIYTMPGGHLLGLRPAAPDDDTFDEDRVGLDHISFEVATLEQLDDAAATLNALGIDHGGVKNIGGNTSILEFRDPDGVALELLSSGQ